jgi:hypothetical protein
MDKIDKKVKAYLDSPEYQKQILHHTVSSPQTLTLIDHIKEKLEEIKVQAKCDNENLRLQMKEGFDEIIIHQKETNGNVKLNTEFRISSQAVTRNLKWFMSFMGFGNIALIIYFIINNLK